MISDSQSNPEDSEVLAQIFKQGAKETPPAKLNYKIISYAANPDKSAVASEPVGSHFGGGWKVPLSMAASVVVVFALLVQLDQSPQQQELPPIPELSIPAEDSVFQHQPAADGYPDGSNEELHAAEEAFADDASAFKSDTNASALDSQNGDAIITDNPAGSMQEKSMNERQDDHHTHSNMAADAELVEGMNKQLQTEAEFAPIAVADWLLMIERLMAQKDYAEAARQLGKFKQAHPKVNVEDLDAKIP